MSKLCTLRVFDQNDMLIHEVLAKVGDDGKFSTDIPGPHPGEWACAFEIGGVRKRICPVKLKPDSDNTTLRVTGWIVVEEPEDPFIPTAHLRWVERVTPICKETVRVLQQKWVEPGNDELEWRDVPVEDE